MYPSILHELLSHDDELTALGITPTRIKELQSIDKRPFDSGHWLITNWLDQDYHPALGVGPRDLQIWVHAPRERSRNYRPIDAILNRIDAIYRGVEHEIGTDGVRVSCVRKAGRSGNLHDEAWDTITRNSTYGVLYDESAA